MNRHACLIVLLTVCLPSAASSFMPLEWETMVPDFGRFTIENIHPDPSGGYVLIGTAFNGDGAGDNALLIIRCLENGDSVSVDQVITGANQCFGGIDHDGNLYLFYKDPEYDQHRAKLLPDNQLAWTYACPTDDNSMPPRPLPNGDMLYLRSYSGYWDYDDPTCHALRYSPSGAVVDSFRVELNDELQAWEFAQDGFVYASGYEYWFDHVGAYKFNPLTGDIAWSCTLSQSESDGRCLSVNPDGSGFVVAGSSPPSYGFMASVRQDGTLYWANQMPFTDVRGLFCAPQFRSIVFSNAVDEVGRYGSVFIGGQLDWYLPLPGNGGDIDAVVQTGDEGYLLALNRNDRLVIARLAGVMLTLEIEGMQPSDPPEEGVVFVNVTFQTGEISVHDAELSMVAVHRDGGDSLETFTEPVSLERYRDEALAIDYPLPADAASGEYDLLVTLRPSDNRYGKHASASFSINETGVRERNSLDLDADGFALLPSYPNPFNSTSTIRFKLQRTSDVSAGVFDVTGREVRTLLNGDRLGAGSHRIVFDGDGLPAGVYFVRVSDGRSVDTEKLLLVK